MDPHARQIETKPARFPPAGPMRHWGGMGHMDHMVRKAGQFGDPEISLGWRHSGPRALLKWANGPRKTGRMPTRKRQVDPMTP